MKKWIPKLPVFFVAIVFVLAGIDKLFHYSGFVTALGSYALLPQSFAPFVAMPLIGVEILVGLAIFSSRLRASALLAAATLLATFTVALTVNLFVLPGSICGCWFTVTLGTATEAHIAQNLFMLGLTLIGWWEEKELTTTVSIKTAREAVT